MLTIIGQVHYNDHSQVLPSIMQRRSNTTQQEPNEETRRSRPAKRDTADVTPPEAKNRECPPAKQIAPTGDIGMRGWLMAQEGV